MDKDVPPPPAKPKLSAEERRARQEDRLAALRLRMAIGRELDERGITEPAAIGAALGLPAAEAAKLLARHRWRAHGPCPARKANPPRTTRPRVQPCHRPRTESGHDSAPDVRHRKKAR